MIRNLLLIAIILAIAAGCGKKSDSKSSSKDNIGADGKTGNKTSDKGSSDGKSDISKLDNTKKKEEDPKFQKPVFQLKDWKSDVKKPEVSDDASNVSVEKLDPEDGEDGDKEIKVPENCIAARLTNKNEKIMWTPKWYFEGVGGIKLPGIAVSPDSSVLAIIETTGTDNGPNGSRIVLFNTYNWQILKIHEYEENKITKLSFLPNGSKIALWSEKQSSIKKPYELLLVGIEKGDVQSASREIKADVSDIVANENYILVKGADENYIYCFDSANLSKSAKKIKSLNMQGVFALSPDKERVVLAGEKYLEIFECSGMDLISKISFDASYAPENAIFAGKNDSIAVSAYNKPGFLFKDGQKKQFCDISGHALSYNGDEKALIFEKYLNNEIWLAEVPDLSDKGHFVPAKINPRTQGTALFAAYLKDNSRYVLLDNYGNLSIYTKYMKSNKWKKKIIFSSKK
ncbi:MAG: hypothetical protein A2X48_18025 [Lentisphaerae bacterium GWF2_49_21]|nr:MAG: hypothetical protein A2X48_18025 [Lentisphaerae bacterium GWF2_49_21]